MADELGAVRRTPRPTGDRQTPETAPQESAGTTNTASPVSGDQPAVSSRVSSRDGGGGLKAMLVELIGFSHEAAEGWHLWNFGHAADAIINAGWRPPREDPGALAELRAKLAEDPDSILFPGPECDMEAYAALPPCMACGGGGQDDHGTVFEASLAVHFAGPPVKAERRVRQLCMWCGHVLIDVALTRDTEPPEWPVGALVRVEDGLATVVPHDPGAELPPGCCALPDDEPADDGLCSKCAAPRTAFDPFGDGLCKQHLAEAYAAENDAERLADEEHDLAAEDATYPEPEPGIPVDNPTTEDTDDWPAEPVEVDRG